MKLLLLLLLGCALVVTTIGTRKESTDGGAQTAELVGGSTITEKTAVNGGNRRPCKRASCFSAIALPARTRRESELEIKNVGKISARRKPCRSGCYSPISVLEQKGSIETAYEKIRTRRQSGNKGSNKRLKFNPKRCSGCFSAVTGISDLLGNGRRDRRNKREAAVIEGKRKPPRKCPGCYSAMARPPRERRDMTELDTPKRHRHGKRGRKEKKNYPEDDLSHAEHEFEDMIKSESQGRHRYGKKGRKEKKGHSEDRPSRRKHKSKDETTSTAMKRKKHHKGDREIFKAKQQTGGFSALSRTSVDWHQGQAPVEKAVLLADGMTGDTRSE